MLYLKVHEAEGVGMSSAGHTFATVTPHNSICLLYSLLPLSKKRGWLLLSIYKGGWATVTMGGRKLRFTQPTG